MKEKLVVIGNGMAGARVVEEILRRDSERFSITMFGAEPYGNYNRILLSNVLNQSQDPAEIFLNPLTWYEENGIRLYAGYRVVGVDRELRRVKAIALSPDYPAYSSCDPPENGSSIEESYDHLIIATGSRPFVPPIEGASGTGVFVFRTLDDCTKIAQYAAASRRASVIGGGLLGLEAARGLMTHDVEVTVIESGSSLMRMQLDTESGILLQRAMEAMGVNVRLNSITTEIVHEDGCPKYLLFRDGSRLETDLVVISTGIRPIKEVAEASGIVCNRGILVDDRMQTSDPSVSALGECVEHRGRLYGLVEPIWDQARVLADILTGADPDARYTGSREHTKLKVMGVDVVSIGEKDQRFDTDEIILYRDPHRGIYKKLIIRDNRLAGAILLGDADSAAGLLPLYLEQKPVPENRFDVLFGSDNTGSLFDPDDLPDHAQICNCNGVSKAEIIDAVKNQGCCSLNQVSTKTKAGKGCGSCRGMIARIIENCAGELKFDPAEHYYVPGVPYEKSRLVREIRCRSLKSVSAVFNVLADGKVDPASKMGLASLLRTIWNDEYEDERDARFINDRVHANIQKDGTFSVVPRIYGGVTTPQELMRIAETALKYNIPMVKFTGGQRIDLLGVKKEDLPAIWKDLDLPSGHAYTKAVRTVKSCVGTDFCRFGLGDSISLAQRLERRFQGIESPHKVKLAVTGCPRNCAEAYVKDIGVVAIEGGKWEIYIGGAAGSRVRKGDLLATVESPEEVEHLAGRFLQYYREHGKYLERTYDFVERLGIDLIRSIVVDDSLGIGAQLDDEIERAVQAWSDPWKEADNPVYPGQFEAPFVVEDLAMVEQNG